MYNDLINKDGISFWQKWNSLNKSRVTLVTRISGETDPKGIAETFASYFESVYGGHDTDIHQTLRSQFHDSLTRYASEHSDDDISPYLLTWSEMIEIISRLKPGKSSSGLSTCTKSSNDWLLSVWAFPSYDSVRG